MTTTVITSIEPRRFMGIVCETPDLVTEAIIDSINRWLHDGNKKEFYNAAEVDVLVDWVMTGK